jgi:benzoyl-CoA reductase subunit D
MTTTCGIDVGASTVKCVIARSSAGRNAKRLGQRLERIRRRSPSAVVEDVVNATVAELGLTRNDLAYVATTGEGEFVSFRTGHFYGMTTHARGAIELEPEARGVLDVGGLHARAILMDERSKVLGYRMTSQCASGSGQFLENISRYLGCSLSEVGELSQRSTEPEAPSGICAVLAETDVINMVSRGISTQNILKGIHTSMADRLVKLLKSTKVGEGTVLVTGGLAHDSGLVATMAERMVAQKMTDLDLRAHPDSIYAGAIGAALWGAFRHQKLAGLEALPKAS